MVKQMHFAQQEKKILTVLFFLLFSLFSFAQQNITVNGTVYGTDNVPLAGVTVKVKGSSKGTASNQDGKFTLEVNKGAVLLISFVGYEPQQVTVNSQNSPVEIHMTATTSSLGEVIVVGYGTQLKREVTGAVQTIEAAKFKDIPVSQITQKLQGRLAGVQINETTGKPGQGMSVRIRGQLSVSAGSDPLYVIDGFPITGNISALNPDEIQDISILKDAASTSLYGSRAANGVVLITTKKGKRGQTHVSFNTYAGLQKVPERGRIKMMDAVEFAQFKKEYYEDEGQPVPIEFQNPSQYKGKNNDWYGALLRKAPLESYNLTVTSNTDKLSTAIIAGVFNQEGVVLNNTYKRYSFRMNSEYSISDKVKIGFNIAPEYVFDNTPRTDGDRGTGILFNALHTWPVMPIYDSTGKLTLYNKFPGSTGNIYNYPNWVRAAEELVNETKTNSLIGNAYIQYQPIKGLTLKSTFNVENSTTKFFFFNPSTATSAMNVPVPTTAVSIRQTFENRTWLNENLATYERDIKDHHFELLAGFTNQHFIQENTRIQADTYTDDRLPTIQGALNINRGGTTNGVEEWALTSFLGRLTYNYQGKYLFTAALRSDGSSRFGNANRWGTFPSASVGWVMSDENFFQNLDRKSVV